MYMCMHIYIYMYLNAVYVMKTHHGDAAIQTSGSRCPDLRYQTRLHGSGDGNYITLHGL